MKPQLSNLEKDIQGHFEHKVIPNATSTVTGNFSVKVISIGEGFCRVELMIVDPSDHSKVLHSFGVVDQILGKPITLEGLESTINFLPKGVM